MLKKKIILIILVILIINQLCFSAYATEYIDIETHWAKSSIEYLVERNIIHGYTDDTSLFRPEQTIRRSEFVKILIVSLGSDPGNSPTGHWSLNYINLAIQNGYLDDGAFIDLDIPITRGEMANLLARALNEDLPSDIDDYRVLIKDIHLIPEPLDQYVLQAFVSGLVTGYKDGTYRVNENAKRSEACTIIHRLLEKDIRKIPQKPEPAKENSLYGIAIGDTKSSVITALGQPGRIDLNEYGSYWYVYNSDYSSFIMVAIDNDKVVGLYTNSQGWAYNKNIKLGLPRSSVTDNYGTPLTGIRKGNTTYNFHKEHFELTDTYLIDGSYTSIFYDLYEDETVTSILIIDKSTEESLMGYYGNSSEELKISYEKQSLDVANAVRARMGLAPFTWNDKIAYTAYKHSKDMIDRDFEDHENPDGKTPFDRMNDDGIEYTRAAENIAAGYPNSIIAHEALMNSQDGHRDNILGDFNYLGVGVSFGGNYIVYYTQNFFS